jgi:Cellulase (glycosyl hydrolase family 5)
VRRSWGYPAAVVLVAATAVLMQALPAAASGCGGLLQPACPPAPAVDASAPDPGGDAAANLPVPPPAGKLFGFNTNLWWQTTGGRDLVPFEVDRSAQAGAEVIRTTVTWATLASSPAKPLGDSGAYPRGSVPGSGALARLDELYDRATAAGLQLDLVINNAPKWASAYAYCTTSLGLYPPGCDPVATGKRLYPTAAHLGDLSKFVTALGLRYPGVTFETWNEPNLDQGPQAVGGAFVGRMQCAVWDAAKALAQPALVLSAAFGDFRGANATRQYLRDFYSTGGACFDRLSVHTYNGSSHSFGAGSPLATHMEIYRDARAEAGDTRPMWISEFGFSTADAPNTVTEADQKTLTRAEYNKLLSMPDVEAAIVNTLRDDAPPPRTGLLWLGASSQSTEDGYGWLHNDGSAKPVYCEFSALADHPAC